MIKFLFGGDSSDLRREAKKGKQSLAELKQEFRDGVNTTAKWTDGIAAAGAAISVHLVHQAMEAVNAQQQLIKVANAGSAEFQRNAFAAKKVNIEIDKLADIYKDMSDRVGDFLNTGGGPMLDFFEQIAPRVGVTAQQFKNLSGPQALQLYVSSLEKANLSQNEMTFYMEAIASDSTMLLPLLRDNGRQMKEFGDQAERAGLILSEVDTQKIQQASVNLDTAKRVSESLVEHLTADLSPIISEISTKFLEMSEEAGGVDEVATKGFNHIIDAAGFVADAIEGIKRVFQIVASSLIVGFEAIRSEALDFAATYTEALDKIPGVPLTDQAEGIRAVANQSRSVMAEAKAEINRLLEEPLPSNSFKKWVQDVTEAADEAAAAIAGDGGQPGDNGQDSGESPLLASQRQMLKKRLEAIKDSWKTEKELLTSQREKDLEALQEAFNNKLLTEEEYYIQSTAIKGKYEQDITQLEADAAKKREQLAKAEAAAKKRILGDALSNLTTLMNSESRKMFEIGKASAIAQAGISTYQMAVDSYKALAGIPYVGPALGAAAAAAALLYGGQQIQAIKSQSFGGGASTAAGSNTGAVNAATQPTGNAGGSGGGGSVDTLFVEGIDPGSIFSGEVVADLAKRLVDFQKDGGEVVFT